jgi:hypothetical protein
MSTATQPVQTATPPPQGGVFDPVAELRTRYPGVAQESEDKIREHLTKPENFRSAFPEYAHLDDATIQRNMTRKAAPAAAPKPEKKSFLQRLWAATPMGEASAAIDEATEGLPNVEKRDTENLTAAAQGKPQPHGQLGQWALRSLQKSGDVVKGAVSPAGLATIGAGVVAPEIVAPAMFAHGGWNLAKSAPGALEGRPEDVEQALMSSSEMAAGGAGIRAVQVSPKPTATGQMMRAAGRFTGNVITGEPPSFKVPEASKSLTQAVQPGVNIPRAAETIPKAGRRLQQMRASGQLTKADGTPLREIRSTGDQLEAVTSAKKNILGEIQNRMGPVKDLQPDVSPVAEAIRGSVDKITGKQFPSQASAIERRAATYDEGGYSIADIESRIQSANKSLRNFYKQPTAGENPTSMDMDATLAEVKTLRELLDKHIENLSGDGVKELKSEYGAMRDLERATARQHAIATRTKGAGLWEGLAYVHAAGDLLSGDALGAVRGAGAVTVGRMLKTLRDPNFLIDQSFHGPKAFEAAEPIAKSSGPPPPKGLLPKPATEAGWTGESDTSGPSRDPGARWTTPAGALPEPKPINAKFLRVIPKNKPGVAPKGLLTAERGAAPSTTIPPAVDEEFARERVRPEEGGADRSPEARLGTMGEGGVRTTPRAALSPLAETATKERAYLHVKAALDTLRSGDRPGRYFIENPNEPGEYLTPQRSQNAAKGQLAGGQWIGVKSARGVIPWLQDVDFTPAELQRAVKAYDRDGTITPAMKSAMEYIERTEGPKAATREPGEDEEIAPREMAGGFAKKAPAGFENVLKATGWEYGGKNSMGIHEFKEPGSNISISVLDKDMTPEKVQGRIEAKLKEFEKGSGSGAGKFLKSLRAKIPKPEEETPF